MSASGFKSAIPGGEGLILCAGRRRNFAPAETSLRKVSDTNQPQRRFLNTCGASDVRWRRGAAGAAAVRGRPSFVGAGQADALRHRARGRSARAEVVRSAGAAMDSVTFDSGRTQTWRVSDRATGVRGAGRHTPGNGTGARDFTYEAIVTTAAGRYSRSPYAIVRTAGWRRRTGRQRRRARPALARRLVRRPQSLEPASRRRDSRARRRGSAIYEHGARETGMSTNRRIRLSTSSSGT